MIHRATAVAEHYAWWTARPSLAPERVCAEAEAVLATLSVLAPKVTTLAPGEQSIAVQLARTAATSFAAGRHWSAWKQLLRSGVDAARLAGEPSEQAYFHHELDILALCDSQYDRACAELEAALALHGALADKPSGIADHRALTLVADRSAAVPLNQ